MVVLEDGLPKRSDYRRFKIRTIQGQDDFAAMEETVRRRFRAFLAERNRNVAEQGRFSYPPSLVLVDGGAGQLGRAVKVLDELEIDIPAIGLAKRMEEVYLPGQPDPVQIPRDAEALYLLQQVRDEAHRFAITYHRQLRQVDDRLDPRRGSRDRPQEEERPLEAFRVTEETEGGRGGFAGRGGAEERGRRSVRCITQLIESTDGAPRNRSSSRSRGHRHVRRRTFIRSQDPRRPRLHGHRQPPPRLLVPAAQSHDIPERHKHLAVVIDSRGGLPIEELQGAVKELSREGVLTRVVFLDAEDDVIVSRYEENKRPHPLGHSTISESISAERTSSPTSARRQT